MTWTQLETITRSEVRETPTPYDITYLWNLKRDTKEPVWNTERCTDTEGRLAAAQGQGVGRRMEWGVGVSRCKLSHLEWSNKTLL